MTEKVDFKLTRDGLVKISHSKTKGEAFVVPESLPVWLENGWAVADPEKDSESGVVVTTDVEKSTGTVNPAPKK